VLSGSTRSGLAVRHVAVDIGTAGTLARGSGGNAADRPVIITRASRWAQTSQPSRLGVGLRRQRPRSPLGSKVPRQAAGAGGYFCSTASAAGLLSQIGSAPYSLTNTLLWPPNGSASYGAGE
jgi:hypothetical protein